MPRTIELLSANATKKPRNADKRDKHARKKSQQAILSVLPAPLSPVPTRRLLENAVATPTALLNTAYPLFPSSSPSASAVAAVAAAAPSSDEAYQSLRQIRGLLGHKFVDVVKVDLDKGKEFDIFNDDVLCPASKNFSIPIGQIIINLHLESSLRNGGSTNDLVIFMHGMHAHGYRIFHRDPSSHDPNVWSYSFTKAAPTSYRSGFLAGCGKSVEARLKSAMEWLKSM
jgi:hypothetical protein